MFPEDKTPQNNSVLIKIKEFIETVFEKDERLAWFLVRAIISAGAVIASACILISCSIILFSLVAPLLGKGMLYYFLWILLPVLVPIAWASAEIAWFIYKEYVDYDL